MNVICSLCGRWAVPARIVPVPAVPVPIIPTPIVHVLTVLVLAILVPAVQEILILLALIAWHGPWHSPREVMLTIYLLIDVTRNRHIHCSTRFFSNYSLKLIWSCFYAYANKPLSCIHLPLSYNVLAPRIKFLNSFIFYSIPTPIQFYNNILAPIWGFHTLAHLWENMKEVFVQNVVWTLPHESRCTQVF